MHRSRLDGRADTGARVTECEEIGSARQHPEPGEIEHEVAAHGVMVRGVASTVAPSSESWDGCSARLAGEEWRMRGSSRSRPLQPTGWTLQTPALVLLADDSAS